MRLPKREFIHRLSDIFSENRNSLTSIAYQILKVREDAEDAVSNAFMQLIQRSKKRYFKDVNLKAYVSKCVENEALKMYNQRKRRVEVEGVSEWNDVETQTPHFIVAGQITMDIIESKLDLVIPPQCAVVWKEHHIYGKSYKVIKDELYLTDNQIKDWIAEATRQLRILLANYQEELFERR